MRTAWESSAEQAPGKGHRACDEARINDSGTASAVDGLPGLLCFTKFLQEHEVDRVQVGMRQGASEATGLP